MLQTYVVEYLRVWNGQPYATSVTRRRVLDQIRRSSALGNPSAARLLPDSF